MCMRMMVGVSPADPELNLAAGTESSSCNIDGLWSRRAMVVTLQNARARVNAVHDCGCFNAPHHLIKWAMRRMFDSTRSHSPRQYGKLGCPAAGGSKLCAFGR